MIANGLTKALGKAEFEEFLQQVNLVDIAGQIVEREAEEGQEELDYNTLGVYMGDIEWLLAALPTASAEGVC